MDVSLHGERVTAMSLINRPPPNQFLNIFIEGYGGAPDLLPVSFPLYVLDIKDLIGDTSNPKPRMAAWQFLVAVAQGKAVAGEVTGRSEDPEGKEPPSTTLNRSAATEECLSASRKVRELIEARSGAYEMRRLRFPALRIEAFWLKAQPLDDGLGQDDLIYPFRTFQSKLKNQLLEMPAFLQEVRILAQDRAKVDVKPKPKSKQA